MSSSSTVSAPRLSLSSHSAVQASNILTGSAVCVSSTSISSKLSDISRLTYRILHLVSQHCVINGVIARSARCRSRRDTQGFKQYGRSICTDDKGLTGKPVQLQERGDSQLKRVQVKLCYICREEEYHDSTWSRTCLFVLRFNFVFLQNLLSQRWSGCTRVTAHSSHTRRVSLPGSNQRSKTPNALGTLSSVRSAVQNTN